MDTILTGGFNEDLLTLANQKTTQLKKDRIALCEKVEELTSRSDETDIIVNLANSWKKADYKCKKEVAMIMIRHIVISEDDSAKII